MVRGTAARPLKAIHSVTASEARLAESTVRPADLAQQIAKDNWQAHERYDKLHNAAEERYRKQRTENEEFHHEGGGRFNALIKMMDEWIRKQGRNGEPIN